MTVRVGIASSTETEFESYVDQAVEWIKSGLVISAPVENGYVYLADAFDHDAVRSIHVMRGDVLGTVAQVLLPGSEVIDGIAREISPMARKLMEEFWPGQLTINLYPQRGLSWDLGDDKRLDRISVRVPSAKFVLALLRKTGPLAVGSAAPAGALPLLDPQEISAREYDLAGIFDAGVLEPAPSSTVVSDSKAGIELFREGAITLQQLQVLVPDIIVPST